VNVSDFDYPLPEELIAQQPVTPRDASRLMVVPRDPTAPLAHRTFSELDQLLRPGDLLVMNDTRVIPARLTGRKESGGKVEVLLLEPESPGSARWKAMGQASKPLRPGARVDFPGFSAVLEEVLGEGFYTVRFDREGAALEEAIAREGALPLPPYIRRAPGPADAERYQTVVARVPGSAAAPTAGLHFTPGLLERLAARGVERAHLTLHVGPGTFLPVRSETVEGHRMHEERYEVPEATARAFAAARARGGRVVAVGTTSVRTLESAFDGRALREGPGRTAIFITPGHRFRAVDALVTNLHLPRSTLLMLVSAFGGTGRVLEAYRAAVVERYRFFSYGDAMLLV
jgi:S-adenosylmethionine:tRNA ribosyltransferase-isomerase